MRIIAGHLQGMKIKAPVGSQNTRPTSAKVREALFSIIQHKIQDAVFIDLFSGTGAMGLEAVSRGAESAHFVEQDKQTLILLKQNIKLATERLQKQGLSKKCAYLYPVDVRQSLKQLQVRCQADIIWADPPYAQLASWVAVFRKTLPLLMKTRGWFILEVASDMLQDATLEQSSWVQIRQKTYGSTSLVMWEYQGENHE